MPYSLSRVQTPPLAGTLFENRGVRNLSPYKIIWRDLFWGAVALHRYRVGNDSRWVHEGMCFGREEPPHRLYQEATPWPSGGIGHSVGESGG